MLASSAICAVTVPQTHPNEACHGRQQSLMDEHRRKGRWTCVCVCVRHVCVSMRVYLVCTRVCTLYVRCVCVYVACVER